MCLENDLLCSNVSCPFQLVFADDVIKDSVSVFKIMAAFKRCFIFKVKMLQFFMFLVGLKWQFLVIEIRCNEELKYEESTGEFGK